MYYAKNAAINDDDKERMLNDAAFLNDGNDNNLNADNDMDNEEAGSDDRK